MREHFPEKHKLAVFCKVTPSLLDGIFSNCPTTCSEAVISVSFPTVQLGAAPPRGHWMCRVHHWEPQSLCFLLFPFTFPEHSGLPPPPPRLGGGPSRTWQARCSNLGLVSRQQRPGTAQPLPSSCDHSFPMEALSSLLPSSKGGQRMSWIS